jgi:ATP-binding protein involved in chromosome partitioning
MADTQPTADAIRDALADFIDPETGQGLVETGGLRDVRIAGNDLTISVGLTTLVAPLWDAIRGELEALLRGKFLSLGAVEVQIETVERPAQPLGQIGLMAKKVIAVGSGKGGVGKSTIAASIAYGLKRSGARVGLMDADVYGPSIPHLLGIRDRPQAVEGRLIPIERDGLKVMSMGLLVPPGEAVVWRGPMLHGAITNFLRDTEWGVLDYLVIDLPPGTGDISLTLSQLLPLSGAVVVCTPQEVALLDAVKAIAMFRKVSIPILGVVENMSYFECPDCNQRHEIFGSGGAKRRAEIENVPFLGETPINMGIRLRGDEGATEANFDDSATAPYLVAICQNLVRNVLASRGQAAEIPSL